MASLTEQQKVCPHRWVNSGEADSRLPSTWYLKCKLCGVMEYDLEDYTLQHRRWPAADESTPEPPRKRGVSLQEIRERHAAEHRAKQKSRFKEQCLKNPRWWLALTPTVLILLILMPLLWIFDLWIASARAAMRMHSVLNEAGNRLMKPILKWTRRPFEKKNDEQDSG